VEGVAEPRSVKKIAYRRCEESFTPKNASDDGLNGVGDSIESGVAALLVDESIGCG
jgi:hypothetical protein